MHRIFLTFILWFAIALSAHASSVEYSVTRTNLDTYFCVFSVLTNATSDGVAFHVTITNKQYDIFQDSSAGVDMVAHKKSGNGCLEGSIGFVEPVIPITLKKEKRVWTADFTVSRELLKNPDVCFVFGVLVHRTINGKTMTMPSADFYELRLHTWVSSY
jgi:hypothetical protein